MNVCDLDYDSRVASVSWETETLVPNLDARTLSHTEYIRTGS
jgi:hypothetical protein